MGTRQAMNRFTCTNVDNICYENYDPCFPDQPVVDLYLPIWAHLANFQSKPAFIWAQDGELRTSITYGQLESSTRSIASQLLTPLQRGDAVLILCSPGLDLLKILFACQRAGLVSVPIFTNQSNPHHLIRALLQTKPKAAIAHSNYIATVRRRQSSRHDQLTQLLQNLKWLPVEGLDVDFDGSDSCSCKPDEVYLIQYTSGATGIPKPVLVTAGSAAHNVRVARKAYDLHPNSVVVSWLPQYHDCGLMFLLLTVICGATCVLTSPTAFVDRPRFWVELISEFKATCTPVPSFALPLTIRRGKIDHGHIPLNLSSLRNLVLINEPIYKACVEEFVDEFSRVGLHPSSISPSYGLAENCTFVSTSWRDDDSCTFPNIPSNNMLLPSARLALLPAEDGEMEILVVNEETGELVEDGVEGEIWVSSPSNASGYLGYPSLTHEVFDARIKGKSSQRFVRTGDFGVVKGEERYLFVTGRISDAIKIGSLRLHPHVLETAAYNSCPSHLRGGCVAAFDIDDGTKIAVIAELQRHQKETDSKDSGIAFYKRICKGIREAIREKERIGVGLVVVLVRSGSIPKTTSGKLQRWAAKEKLRRGEFKVVFADEDDEMNINGDQKRQRVKDAYHRLYLFSLL